MQGINPLTMKCTYITPCGWCARQNKKCDIEENRGKKKKYDDLLKPCYDCDNKGWDMPECKECNNANGFKYFKTKEK